MALLQARFRIKATLWSYLANDKVSVSIIQHFYQGKYLPTEKNCPLGFLQQLCSCEKKVFQTVRTIEIENPGWPEFSNKAVWAEAVKNPDFMQYVPDTWTFDKGGREPEKNFVWVITCTLQPQWVTENIDRIRTARYQYKIDSQIVRPPTTFIAPEWIEELLSIPFIPSKYNKIILPFFETLLIIFWGIENKKGNGVLLYKAKAPKRFPVGKLNPRKKPPTYSI